MNLKLNHTNRAKPTPTTTKAHIHAHTNTYTHIVYYTNTYSTIFASKFYVLFLLAANRKLFVQYTSFFSPAPSLLRPQERFSLSFSLCHPLHSIVYKNIRASLLFLIAH